MNEDEKTEMFEVLEYLSKSDYQKLASLLNLDQKEVVQALVSSKEIFLRFTFIHFQVWFHFFIFLMEKNVDVFQIIAQRVGIDKQKSSEMLGEVCRAFAEDDGNAQKTLSVVLVETYIGWQGEK